MRLVIHMGLHKTATTSFQEIGVALVPDLAGLGLRFAVQAGEGNAHVLCHAALTGDFSLFDAELAAARAALPADGTLLISAEDFENLFLVPEQAARLEARARNAGFDQVDWAVTRRSPFTYFESLYAELSHPAHCQVLRYDLMGRSIIENGYFSAIRPGLRWDFAFDHTRLFAAFDAATRGRLICFGFDEFLNGFAGRVLLQACGVSADACDAMSERHGLGKNRNVNPRPDPQEVERRYVERFLAEPPKRAHGLRGLWRTRHQRWLLDRRLRTIAAVRPEMKAAFAAAFDGE